MMPVPSVCFGDLLKEEICLEGLDGISVESLWMRVHIRLGYELNENLKRRFWKIVLHLKQIQFFELPEPRSTIKKYDRFASFDDVALILQPDPNIDIYPYHPIKNVRGSCKTYETRIDISAVVKNESYESAVAKWPNTLVIVGDLRSRWNALAPELPFSICEELSGTIYCILERIGRARYNGEVTAGVESLSLLENDPKTLSYFHKQLIAYNLVIKQQVNIKFRLNNATPSVLLQLPRFYRKILCLSTKNIELVEMYLKQQPNRMASLGKIKEFLSPSQIKYLLKRREFREKVQVVHRVPYREVYPNAPEAEYLTSTGQDRIISTVQLLEKPKEKENTDVINDRDDDENTSKGSFDFGEGLLQQVYSCIRSSKNKGMTLKDIEIALSIDSSTARYAIKYVVSYGLLYTTFVDRNRQRIIRYITNEFKEKSEEFQREHSRMESISSNPDQNNKKLALTKNNHTNKNSSFALSSLKKIQRASIILEFLRKEKITSKVQDISKYISQVEASNNEMGGTIARRSLISILQYMEGKGQLKIHRIKVSVEPIHCSILFVSEMNIDRHHQYIKSTIEDTKQRLIMQKSTSSSDIKPLRELISSKVKTDKEIANPYPLLPKFCKLRLLHEFLFYLVYDHQNKECKITPHIRDILKGEKYFQEHLPCMYDKCLDKCIFVPPVASNSGSDRPPGWLMLSDAINRMPLCIYSKLIKIDLRIPGIIDYLIDPIKSQILLTNLPDSIQYYLMEKGKHKFIIYRIVEQLCLLGLVQFGEQVMKIKDKFFVFLNRNAILWDTTPSKAGYHRVEDKEYSREVFGFQTKTDVDNYWERLFTICNNTRLGDRYASLGEEVEYQAPELKMAYALKKQTFEEAVKLDIGYIPGDGFGAAGLDSTMYSHLKRSWTNGLFVSAIKTTKKKITDRPHISTISYPRKKPLMARGQPHIASSALKKKVIRTLVPRIDRKIRMPKIDDVDKKMLQKLGTKRATWNVVEDQLLFLCKIGLTILHPCGYLPYFQIIRDIFQATFAFTPKTSFALKRRILFLMRNPQNMRYVEISLIEVRRCDIINKRYYNLFSRFKFQKSVNPMEDCKIHFVELVHVLYLLLVEKNIGNQLSVQIPTKISELYQKFSVETPSLHTFNRKVFDVHLKTEIRGSVLSSLIHSALWCSVSKENCTFSLLGVYRSFPELILRSTIFSLRTSGMIAMRRHAEKSLEKKHSTKKFSSNTSHYKLSNNYLFQSISLLPYKIYTQIYEFLNMLQEKNVTNKNLGILSGGTTAALLVLSMINCVELNINIMNVKENCEDEFASQSEMPEEHSLYFNGPNIKTCDLTVSLLSNVDSMFPMTTQKVEKTINDIVMDAVFIPGELTTKECDVKDSDVTVAVFDFISEKCEFGADPKDLEIKFISTQQCTILELQTILKELVKMNTIRRIGYNTIKWVAEKYLSLWYVKAVPSNEEVKRTKTIKSSDSQETDVTDKENSDSKLDEIEPNFEHEDLQKALQCDVGEKRKHSHDEQDDLSSKKHCENDIRNTENDDLEQFMDCDDLNTVFESSEILNINSDHNLDEISRNNVLKMVNEGQRVYIFPRPWIRPNGSLNHYVFFRWTGAILNYILYHPFVKLVALHTHFNYLPLHQIRILIEVLEKIECAQMVRVKSKKPSLWSKPSVLDITTEPLTGLEDDNELHVEALEGAILKFALFKGSVFKR